MKKLIFILLLLSSLNVFSQKITEYNASNGVLYKVEDSIKLGRGSGENGNFVYFSTGGWAYAANGGETAGYLNHTFAGTTVNIKKIKKVQEKIVFIVGAGGVTNYNLIIEDAIATCEIENCNKNNTNTQEPSKLDELKKLKELFDSGVLTQEEFDSEKKKILEKK